MSRYPRVAELARVPRPQSDGPNLYYYKGVDRVSTYVEKNKSTTRGREVLLPGEDGGDPYVHTAAVAMVAVSKQRGRGGGE